MTDKPNDKEEKKIIIDEDWKSKVQAEKDERKREPEDQQQQTPQPEHRPEPELPPPTLDFLVSSLAMQAMVAMGVIVNPVTEKTDVQLDQAKHFIDTIDLLREKTEGNRNSQETAVIDNLLHELQMTYVSVQQKAGT